MEIKNLKTEKKQLLKKLKGDIKFNRSLAIGMGVVMGYVGLLILSGVFALIPSAELLPTITIFGSAVLFGSVGAVVGVVGANKKNNARKTKQEYKNLVKEIKSLENNQDFAEVEKRVMQKGELLKEEHNQIKQTKIKENKQSIDKDRSMQ